MYTWNDHVYSHYWPELVRIQRNIFHILYLLQIASQGKVVFLFFTAAIVDKVDFLTGH